jgi:hypothetical protein
VVQNDAEAGMSVRARAVVCGAVAVMATAAAAMPGAAAAKTVRCRIGKYSLVHNDEYTEVSQLRAIGLPAKTSDYAPPCLVAESIASWVQYRHGRPKRRIHVYGARWDGGWWRLSHYTDDLAYDRWVAKKGSQRVTFAYGL